MSEQLEMRIKTLEGRVEVIQTDLARGINRFADELTALRNDMKMVAGKFELAIDFSKRSIPIGIVVYIFMLVFALNFGIIALKWFFEHFAVY